VFMRLFPVLQRLPHLAQSMAGATLLALATLTPVAAQTVTATIAAGTTPRTPALNPVTGKVYVPNRVGGVTVIDGSNNSTSTIAAGTSPIAVAVNPVTDKIYVANSGSNNVTIIDGASGTTSTVAVGVTPFAVAVDTRANRIYVANSDSNTVTVIDGDTGTVSGTVPVGGGPRAIGINATTNRIYVANGLAATVTVIDGSNLSTSTVNVAPVPGAIAVNPVTNKIYVASLGANSIDVIDGATNTTSSINPGPIPTAIAVNPATNRVYVACGAANSVTMIDVDAANAVTSIPVGSSPRGISIDAMTNLIYVTNNTGNSVSVIRGRDNTVSTLAVGTGPNGIAANPLTNQVYVMNQNSNNVSVIDGRVSVSVNVGLANSPSKIAINEVTNKIYVNTNGVLTVIDGATLQTTVVNTPATGVVVNPITNKIYVGANYGFGVYLRVIDGDTLQVRDINFPANGFINDLAINPVTNRIYAVTVASGPGPATGKLLVFDGDTETLLGVIPVGNNPVTVLANPANNLIYIANNASNSMTIVDGANILNQSTITGLNSPWFVALNPANNAIFISSRLGNLVTMLANVRQDNNTVVNPDSIAVNPVTNRAYVVNLGTANTVTVLNGVNNSVITTINVGAVPRSVAVNSATNKIYVGTAAGFVAIIDGATNTFTTVPSGTSSPYALVNNVTGRAYIANSSSNNVTVIGGPAYNKHAPVFRMNGGSVTGFGNPQISVSTTGAWTPNDPPVNKLYYRLGTTGSYSQATGTGPFDISLSGLTPGTYTLSAFATDDMQGTSMNTGGVDTGGTGSMIGTPGSFRFSVVTPTTQIDSITSRKNHAGYGDCDVPIDKTIASFADPVSVEPRAIGAGHLLLFRFNEAVNFAGTASVVDATGSPVGDAPTVTMSGNEVQVTINGIPDNRRVRVGLAGVNAMIDVSAYLGFLVGDINASRAINATDISGMKARSGQPLDAANCRFDLNASGAINAGDIAAVKARAGQVLP
jgi:YVTN family beta-propeller protein